MCFHSARSTHLYLSRYSLMHGSRQSSIRRDIHRSRRVQDGGKAGPQIRWRHLSGIPTYRDLRRGWVKTAALLASNRIQEQLRLGLESGKTTTEVSSRPSPLEMFIRRCSSPHAPSHTFSAASSPSCARWRKLREPPCPRPGFRELCE